MEELRTINNTFELTNKELKDYTKKLRKCGDNIRTNYIKIAYLLKEVEDTECYLDDGFESAIDYASKVLNIQKTTSYNLIKIANDFINEEGTRTKLTESGDDYGVSQVQALLPLGFEKAKELHDNGDIDPSMSVRMLKAIVNPKGEPEPEVVDDDEDDNDIVCVDGEQDKIALALHEFLSAMNTLEIPTDAQNDIIDYLKDYIPDEYLDNITVTIDTTINEVEGD